MSGVSLPVNRPVGRALIVGSAVNRAGPVQILQRMYGFECAEADDPYNAMLELCRRKIVYNAVILSLASLYREELTLIATMKRRFPHMEVWLTHTDGRQRDLAEAMRLGADGLLGEDGLHRIAPVPAVRDEQAQVFPKMVDEGAVPDAPAQQPAQPSPPPAQVHDEPGIGEPVLTTDELRALLQDQPSMPPSNPSPLPPGEG